MTSQHKPKLGLTGFSETLPVSFERTRRWYHRALEPYFNLIDVQTDPPEQNMDALLCFTGNYSVSQKALLPPRIIPIHGDAIINRSVLAQALQTFRTCDILIANCKGDIDALSDILLYPENTVQVLPLPVESRIFVPLDQNFRHSSLQFAYDDLVLGFVGRLIPQKGVHWFIDILCEAKRALKGRAIKGLVIGDFVSNYSILPYVTATEYRTSIEKQLAKRGLTNDVLMLPSVRSDDELARFYNSMDILVHPTNTVDENFGYVAIEAMACGVPVIATNYGGLRDSVVQGQTGYLVETWPTEGGIRLDFRSACQYVVELLSNDELRKSMGDAARQRALSEYSFSRFEATLCQIVQHAISQFPSAIPIQQAQLRKTDCKSYLPITSPDWTELCGPVSKYTSLSEAQPLANSLIFPAGEFARMEGNLYRFSDPCWPASYHLSKTDLEILAKCTNGQTYASLLRTFQATAIDSLLSAGILTMKFEPRLHE